MTKQRFVSELRAKLSGLPQVDLEDRVLFYSKMFDSITDNGYTEAFATAEIGDIDGIVDGILLEYPLSKIVMGKMKSMRKLTAGESVLLILSSPIWLSLLIAAIAVIFAVYLAICAVVISMWVIGTVLEVAGLIAAAWGILIVIQQGNMPTGIAMIGAGLCGVGGSAFIFYSSRSVTRGLRALTKKASFGVKKSLIGREQKSDHRSAVTA